MVIFLWPRWSARDSRERSHGSQRQSRCSTAFICRKMSSASGGTCWRAGRLNGVNDDQDNGTPQLL
jgi:hypothetical protein